MILTLCLYVFDCDHLTTTFQQSNVNLYVGLIKHYAMKEYERLEVHLHAFVASELKLR